MENDGFIVEDYLNKTVTVKYIRYLDQFIYS